mmetsp:Transcript_30987/g.75564  ORF Transcript_30987/g.75564 Transcript_30987/m.75564 type:complete len:116 (+) Transcript_30987:1952-2299(+)
MLTKIRMEIQKRRLSVCRSCEISSVSQKKEVRVDLWAQTTAFTEIWTCMCAYLVALLLRENLSDACLRIKIYLFQSNVYFCKLKMGVWMTFQHRGAGPEPSKLHIIHLQASSDVL